MKIEIFDLQSRLLKEITSGRDVGVYYSRRTGGIKCRGENRSGFRSPMSPVVAYVLEGEGFIHNNPNRRRDLIVCRDGLPIREDGFGTTSGKDALVELEIRKSPEDVVVGRIVMTR